MDLSKVSCGPNTCSDRGKAEKGEWEEKLEDEKNKEKNKEENKEETA